MTDTNSKIKLLPSIDSHEASRRCTALVHRITISQAIVGSALEVPKVSDSLGREVLRGHLSGETGLADLLPRLIQTGDPAKPLDLSESLGLIAKGMANQTVINTEMVIAAAVVVLSHSTADDVFTSAVELAIDLDPNGWISEINLDRAVTLKQIYEDGTERILIKALNSFRNQLGRKESLPSRAELLFRKIKILHNSRLAADDPKRFKLKPLKDADSLRVKVVHGAGLPNVDLGYSRSIAEFLHEAAFTAIRSVGGAFDLPLDMTYFEQLSTAHPMPLIGGGTS